MTVEEEEINSWLFDLFLRREILADYEQPMYALASMCRSREEFELIMHSAEKLVVLSEAQHSKQIQRMTKFIRENIIKDQSIAIVATAWGEQPDSSQQLVQRLKVHFRGSKNVMFFNSVNAYEKKDFMSNFPKFVLVDEFSGTGDTIIKRLTHLSHQAKSRSVNLEPHVCILFGMEKAAATIRMKGIDVHFCTELKAGISGYFDGAEREQKISQMKRLEEHLAPEIEGIPLPSLGHGKAEALFFVREMNAPNSNFPIFWWPLDTEHTERNTVMHRAEL